MAAKNTANIGFEKQIWDAACVLRGNLDASEYKSVVPGLIFLKYISDRFEDKYRELVEEGEGFEEDRDEYTSEGIFFVPGTARWSVIASAAHKPENIRDFYKNGELIQLTHELTETLRKNRTIDWKKKEMARASMRRMVKRLLKKYKYPPESYETAINTVISRCEMWTDQAAG